MAESKKFEFHGSFLDKQKATEKEQEVRGFIRERKVEGKVRYFVLSKRE